VKQIQKRAINSIALTLGILLSAVSAFAQDAPSGKYEGTAKVAGSADTQIALELKNEGGKISGHLMNGETKIEISEASFAEGKLSLKLGPAAKDGVLTATVTAEKISGDWVAGTQKKVVELKKAVAAVAAAPANINLNGQWDAVADANGQPFPFLLVLNIDGEKVTGSSSSQLGESKITTGTWKDGKLNFQMEGQNGTVTMSATVVDGKLSGEFDFSGQLQGRWVAVKKN
jgi:hypothetical protein